MAIFDNVDSGVYLECSFKAGVWVDDNTPPTEFFDPANFTSVDITPPKQNRERILSQRECEEGRVLGSVTKTTDPAAFKGSINTFDKTLSAIILGADIESLTVAAKTVTDTLVTTKLNTWVTLPDKYLSETGFALTTNGNVDIDAAKYEVDYRLGLIKAIHADAVGTDMKASYSVVATTGTIFNSGLSKTTKLKFIGTCTHKQTCEKGQLIIHRVACVSDQAANFTQKFLEGTLTGDLEVPAGETYPWRFIALN